MNSKELIEKLKNTIKKNGLKYTKQKETIFLAILNSSEHLNAEDIYRLILVKDKNNQIGLSTIYRTLIFLEDNKLISSLYLKNTNIKKFETNLKEHHDHIICTKCDKIIEFVNDKIENEHKKLVKKYDFILENHSMILYGICKECQK